MINKFIYKNYKTSVAIGFIAAIGGVILAYLTNDTEPFGTIGGFISALGLMFVIYAGSTKSKA